MMKVQSVLFLYGLAALLAVGVAVVKIQQGEGKTATTRYLRGDLPFKNLEEVATLQIENAEQRVTLSIKEGQWVVEERNNYPANQDMLRSFMRKLHDLSVVQSLEAGPRYDPRFGMDEDSSVNEKHGHILTLTDADGSSLLRLKVGKQAGQQEASQDPMAALMGGASSAKGRFIRLDRDPQSIYLVGDPLQELVASPQDWLREEFLQVEDPLRITLSPAGKPAEVAWALSRERASEAWNLAGDIPEGMTLNASALDPLKKVLSYVRFEDVVSEEAVEGLGDRSQERLAVIESARGFTYHLTIIPKRAEGSDSYLLKVSLPKAAFPETLEEQKEGSNEEAAAENPLISEQKNAFEQKKALTKSLENRYFEVSSWTLNALLKDRSAFFTSPPEESSKKAAGPRSAVSPAIQMGQ